MLFSVIVPVYNNPGGLKILLESLIRQDLRKALYEIIIVDDGSRDNTADMAMKFCSEYPGLIRCLREDENKGPYAARNKGICHSRGEILAFTDSDCVVSKDWLFSALEHMRSYRVSCTGGAILFTYLNKNRPNPFEYLDSTTYLDQKEYVNRYHFAATANFFANKEVFEKYGYFRPELRFCGDVEFGIRLYSSGERIRYAPNAIVHHQARSSFCSLFARVKMVASGRRHLVRIGVFKEAPFSLKSLAPNTSFPLNKKIYARLSLIDKAALTVLSNIFRWVDLYYMYFNA
jgi:glycosyltransferase involved in cell wall biosynthesis